MGMRLLHVSWSGNVLEFMLPEREAIDVCADAFMERPPGTCATCDLPAVDARLGSGSGGLRYHLGVSPTCGDPGHVYECFDRHVGLEFTVVELRWTRVGPYTSDTDAAAGRPVRVLDYDGVAVHDGGPRDLARFHVLPITNGRLLLPDDGPRD